MRAIHDGRTAKQRYFDKKLANAKEIECACGCLGLLKDVDEYGRKVTFINGHNRRQYTGEDATPWSRQKRYRVANPEKHRDYRRLYYRDRKRRAMRLLGNKCSRCPIEYNGRNAPIFEFHHEDPRIKDAGITRMLTNKAWEVVKLELAKCVLICANCHNQHHGGEW